MISETGTVTVLGGNAIALKGQLVQFECDAVGWYPEPSLHWEVNGKKVNKLEESYMLKMFVIPLSVQMRC